MRVILAQPRGFCAGVVRAIEIVERALEKYGPPVYVRHEIVHNQGKRYVGQGRTLILIGHAGHPEVEGTMGQIPAQVHLVQTEADVDKLEIPTDAPVAYVTQTTLSVDYTRGII